MSATATLGAPQDTFVIDEPKAKSRPTIVISVPRWFRRVEKTTVAVATTIKDAVVKAFNAVWRFKAVRYVSYFLAAVTGTVLATFAITFAGLLLALPFLALGWYVVADVVFMVSTIILWYIAFYQFFMWLFPKLGLD